MRDEPQASSAADAASRRAVRRNVLVHAVEVVVAAFATAVLTVFAIAMGWLPLCEKAVGIAFVSLNAVLLAVFELVRRHAANRPRA